MFKSQLTHKCPDSNLLLFRSDFDFYLPFIFIFQPSSLFFQYFGDGLGLTQQTENVSMVTLEGSKKNATVHHFWESVFKSLSNMSCLTLRDVLLLKSIVTFFILNWEILAS